MRNTLFILPLLTLLVACEKVPVVEAQVKGDGLAALYEDDGPKDNWVIKDDWHGLFMVTGAGPERLRFFVRSYDESTVARPDVWWAEGARPMELEVATVCDFEVQYFDNPGNSFANNFLSPGYPEIYPYSPETAAPGFSAILVVQDCIGGSVGVSISVFDESGEPARQHKLTIQVEQVDWYYNPLLFQ